MISTKAFILQTAKDLGFEACGVSRAERLVYDEKRLERWLGDGMHGTMQVEPKEYHRNFSK